jgi:hypothetical protein
MFLREYLILNHRVKKRVAMQTERRLIPNQLILFRLPWKTLAGTNLIL